MKHTHSIYINIIKTAKKQFAVFVCGSIILSILSPIMLLATEKMVNSVVSIFQNEDRYMALLLSTVAVAILHFLSHYMIFFNEKSTHKLRIKLYGDFSNMMLEKYKNVDFSCFESETSRNVISHIGNAPQEVILSYFKTLLALISGGITAVGFLLVFFSLSPLFGLLGLVAFVFMIYFNNKRVKMMAELYDEQTNDERKLTYLNEVLSNKASLLDLKINTTVEYIQNKANKLIDKILKERISRTVKSQLVYSMGTLCLIVWIGIVVSYIVLQTITSTISYGMVIALLGATQNVCGCFEKMSTDYASLLRCQVNIKYLNQFLQFPQQDNLNSTSYVQNFVCKRVDSDNKGIDILFDNVSFCYPGTDTYILKDLSFKINTNQKTAFVGENGCGKTTIVKLLCGFYRPTQGRILINGVPIDKLRQKDLSNIFGTVFQDYSKYYFTLRENVAIGDLSQVDNDDRIYAALDTGLLPELKGIIDSPLGNIEDNGIDLSGGQWQKVALTRACFKGAEYLILDEPTASMDPNAENMLYHEFLKIMKQQGCLVITHRLALAKYVDNILVIKNGKVEECGSHEELYNKDSIYRTMYEAQSHWYV